MSSTPSCPELQPDIVNLIIDELHDSRPDLKTCALVCRSWVSQSRFHLFSRILLNQNNVFPFLALCASPHSTIPLARISDFIMATNLYIKGEPEDKQFQGSPAFDQFLTWRSPHDGKSIADVFRHLRILSLDWIGWRPLSETARSMLHSAFQTVTELRMRNVIFETGDEFREFLSSLICLERLYLDGVSLRAPGQASTMQSNVFSPHFHTIDMKNLSPDHSGRVIHAMTPCLPLKNLGIHVSNLSNMNADYSMAVGDLLVSAGPSLESFFFYVPGMLKEGVDWGKHHLNRYVHHLLNFILYYCNTRDSRCKSSACQFH
ncbi:hypothetical protein K435DRAFT_760455 [Dendrothele bispora CBS 962.96]|uniref:F-box domain-containing protein n=1 Tax=Dendrothele bispora (strain CBS 962.96) TaxID=1314807 RepID=A0A4S8LM67_DENBC|nr:hypothetical protein K435DRAFT_760455 [Dendrothele bispora CBS 962.96]